MTNAKYAERLINDLLCYTYEEAKLDSAFFHTQRKETEIKIRNFLASLPEEFKKAEAKTA